MEKINIAELLKDCPTGMELDCTVFDNIVFDSISNLAYPIKVITKDGSKSLTLTKYGCITSENKNAKCVIFPKGKTTWKGFHRPFKDGDVVIDIYSKQLGIYKTISKYDAILCQLYFLYDFEKNIINRDFNQNVNRFALASEEEKEELFKVIKDNGYHWDVEKKTLEKLIEPKLKEIHFYKDSFGTENLYDFIIKTHNATVFAIKNEWSTIYSYAISALCFSDLLDKGYKIFLHENGKCGELHEGTTELTDKELRKHHDIRKIWIGGGFEDFFYSKDE